MRRILCLLVALLQILAMCACGKTADNSEILTAETPLETEEPVIETPEVEIKYDEGMPVTVEGVLLTTYIVDGNTCVKNDELQNACSYDILTDAEYVPVEKWCEENGIGTLYDEENSHLYCTRAAGNWTYPEGYNVPVLMYHEVQPDEYGANDDTVKLSEFQKQMEYLYNEGFTPIWFEDLERIDEYSKPVILSFDDGYVGNYLYVLPVLEQYGFKATVFYLTGQVYNVSWYLTVDQVKELSDSGLVQIESHTVTHPQLDLVDTAQQEYELNQSKLDIARITGKIPYVIAYPYGATTSYVIEQIHSGNYRFGIKMVGLRSYNTSDDCATVWRFYPRRSMQIDEYSRILESCF